MTAFTDRRNKPGSEVESLTQDELHALAFCVDHMLDKHGYSSIVSRDGARVPLEELLQHIEALVAAS